MAKKVNTNIRTIVKYANRAVKLYCAILVPVLIIWFVWNQNWMKHRKENGRARIVRLMVVLPRRRMTMSIKSFAEFAKMVANCCVVIHVRQPITLSVLIHH